METIIVLTSTFPRWQGDEEPPFVYELSRRFTRSYKVMVLSPHCQGAKPEEILAGIQVIRFRYFFEKGETLCYQGGIIERLKQNPLRHLLLPSFFFFQTFALFRLIRKVKPAAVHAHWIIPQALSCVLAGFFLKEKPALIFTSHGGDLYSLKGKWLNKLKSWVLHKADSITVVNSKMKTELAAIRIESHNVEVIPMGVDLKSTFVANDSIKKPFSLLFIGRLVEKKGLIYLLDAWSLVIRKYPRATLTIIGTGPLEKLLKQQVINLDLSNHVVFLGSVRNGLLPEYYQTHQLAVFPFVVSANGDREGLPVVISEAMGCGCTILTTDLPGIDDLVMHNRNGIIVAQQDSSELAKAILYLFDNPLVAEKLAKAALKDIQSKQDWDIIANRYINTIQHCINAVQK